MNSPKIHNQNNEARSNDDLVNNEDIIDSRIVKLKQIENVDQPNFIVSMAFASFID